MNDDEQKYYDEFAKEIEKEIAAAHKDSLVYGAGFLSINADGKVRHVTLKELESIIDDLQGGKLGH